MHGRCVLTTISLPDDIEAGGILGCLNRRFGGRGMGEGKEGDTAGETCGEDEPPVSAAPVPAKRTCVLEPLRRPNGATRSEKLSSEAFVAGREAVGDEEGETGG